MSYKRTIFGGIVAFIIATSCCWLPFLLVIIGGGSTLVGLSNGLEKFSGLFMFLGAGLLVLGIYQYKRKMIDKKTVITQSKLTCPKCGYKKLETMPTNACQYFYECENCNEILKPKEKDCCVYCSYGTVPCPPIQLNENCC